MYYTIYIILIGRAVPFMLKCGKAIDSRKAEIRIQFKAPANTLFGSEIYPNELVLRVQPDEAVYLKLTTKQPGLETGVRQTELDLSYKSRFVEAQQLPDAYERLIYDVLRGDHNLFVRSDELSAAWKIFTPILHQLDNEHIKPIDYDYGSRGPQQADKLIKQCGYVRTTGYDWSASHPTAATPKPSPYRQADATHGRQEAPVDTLSPLNKSVAK